MSENKKNYSVTNVGAFSKFIEKGRGMLGEELDLTSCEISINSLPAEASIPFVHSHQENEEVYIIISGEGQFMVDGDEFAVTEGTCLRIAPAGERTLKAGQAGLTYICIQAQKDSLKQATEADGVMHETKASWM